ncbi:hypothetical protein ACROYT_G021756 [Oculina patagonica]
MKRRKANARREGVHRVVLFSGLDLCALRFERSQSKYPRRLFWPGEGVDGMESGFIGGCLSFLSLLQLLLVFKKSI